MNCSCSVSYTHLDVYKRQALGRLLLLKPDLLLLDEPTNHLDVESIEWLENYLKNYPHAIIMVSHDRYFIDQISNQIVEIEHGKATTYKCSYQEYAIIDVYKRQDLYDMKKNFQTQSFTLLFFFFLFA